MLLDLDSQFLKQALALATMRRGFCAPNPAVGAVVVKNNMVLSQGYHQASGAPHAEVVALKNLGEEANDATLYVTLEPCCHFGKTPPCTELLIQRGIKKVIFGFRDLNPQVAAKSEEILRAANIACLHLPLAEIDAFYQSYAFWWQHKKPYVTAKLAMSLDGKIAGNKGERLDITGQAAQTFTHQQRKQSDAILTTAKTILHDNPQLNVRLTNEMHKKPLYILDRKLTTPLTANIFSSTQQVTLFHQKNISAEQLSPYQTKGVRCIAIDDAQNELCLDSILQIIGEDGIHDLWVEAGGICFAAFLNQRLLQKAFIYVAPKWLGDNAQSAFPHDNELFASVRQKNWQVLGEDAVCELIW